MPHLPTLVVFNVADARLAVRTGDVLEVLPLMTLHRVPEAPELVTGFLLLEKVPIPILRLERLLALSQTSPEPTLAHRLLLMRSPEGPFGWVIEPNADVERFDPAKTVRLPAGHVLNNCAQWVIPRPPPEPSIVLLEPERLLLEKERRLLEELRTRAQERLAAIPD